MTTDRRQSARRKIFIQAEIDTGQGRTAIALSRDVSETGLLLLTLVPMQVGTSFRVFIVRPDRPGGPLELAGRVVRSSPLSLDHADVWKYQIAVELLDPPADFAKTLEDLSALPIDV
jgi:hypothetical protein